MTTPYTEEDVERGVAAIMKAQHGAQSWTYEKCMKAILDDLAARGRLLPPGAKTEWGCATPSEIRKQDPARWSTREAAEEHGNCGSCVIVSRITTPWSAVPDTNQEEERLVEGGHAWSPPGDIQQCVNCHLTRAAYFATSVRRPCPRRPKEETSALV